MNPLIVIPSRLASTRLPNKPLADIHGYPMIVQCLKRAEEAKSGPVIVAAGDQEIADAIHEAGGIAIMTDPDLPSGSDRVWQAVEKYDPDGNHDIIINVQGDLPTLDPHVIKATIEPLNDAAVDISTAVAEISDEEERTNPNVVKAYIAFAEGQKIARALTFTRATAPFGEGPLYHHIGRYGYRREALKRFISMEPGILEQREKLEQLRALEAGMRIDAALVETVPLGVDTAEDLEKARKALDS